MLWDRLCDEGVDAQKLMAALSAKNKQLVLGTEVIYEWPRHQTQPRSCSATVRLSEELHGAWHLVLGGQSPHS